MEGRISEAKAIKIGLLVVNGPVLLLMFAPPAVVLLIAPNAGVWAVLTFAIGWICAWLWWSVSVPKWRLWAFERVENIAKLKQIAVSAGLTWPDGHFFERTEIKSKAHTAKEKALEWENSQN